MRAMILAAGRGVRMRPLTERIPKPLLTIGGEPLIVHLIGRLAEAGFDDIVIGNNFGSDQIRIASIRRLKQDELDELLIRYGKKKPEFEVSPATEDVEGAEVEELD